MQTQRTWTPRYDSLDIWRGVACLLVLLNHAVLYRGAVLDQPAGLPRAYAAIAAVAARLWIGVPIFFVISGYCIAAAADSHARRGSPLTTYFLRRFRRIFPPYWVVLFVTAVLVAVFDVLWRGAIVSHSELLRPWWYSPTQWLGSITLTEIWRPHLFGSDRGLVLGHAWTLCYEEQFYAVCGVLLLLTPRRFFAGAAAVSVAVLLMAAAGPRLGFNPDGFFFDGSWLQFALGMLVYWALNHGSPVHRWLAAAGLSGVTFWALSYGTSLLALEKNAAQQFLVAGAFALIALTIRPLDARMMQSPLLQPVRRCGIMCYSLYLVHLPLINLLRAGLAASGVDTLAMSPPLAMVVYGAPSIWVSWQFHLLVERRFLNSAPPRPADEPALLLAV